MKKILVIHGPNLNLLGQREKDIYGNTSLEEINKELSAFAKSKAVGLETFQSNHEGEIVDQIGKAKKSGFSAILINPAAYTHTSVALRDALIAVGIPFVEVHLSAVQAREPFRQRSYFADVAMGVISGFQGESYMLALQAIVNRIDPPGRGG